MRSEEVQLGLETMQPLRSVLFQFWTEEMRNLLRSVSLSVSLLVHVLVSKATEEVTGPSG